MALAANARGVAGSVGTSAETKDSGVPTQHGYLSFERHADYKYSLGPSNAMSQKSHTNNMLPKLPRSTAAPHPLLVTDMGICFLLVALPNMGLLGHHPMLCCAVDVCRDCIFCHRVSTNVIQSCQLRLPSAKMRLVGSYIHMVSLT